MEYNNPVYRAIKIIQLFSLGRKITVNELYDVFEGNVSKRTIQRDLITISDAGIPLITDKGYRKENIWTVDRQFFKLFPIPLTLNEYVIAGFMKKALPVFKKTPIEKAYKDLLDKMDQLISKHVYETISSDNELFENVFDSLEFGYYDYSAKKDFINQLTDCIIRKTICTITYQSLSQKEAKNHKVEPYKILVYQGALYLAAFIREYDKFYNLAVHRIQKINITKETFIRDQNYDEKSFAKDRFGMMSLKAEEVVLNIDKEILPHIEGRIWHHSQKVKNNKDGSMTLSMKVSISDELTSWILKWKGHIKIIKPKTLKDEMLKIVDEMRSSYL